MQHVLIKSPIDAYSLCSYSTRLSLSAVLNLFLNVKEIQFENINLKSALTIKHYVVSSTGKKTNKTNKQQKHQINKTIKNKNKTKTQQTTKSTNKPALENTNNHGSMPTQEGEDTFLRNTFQV